MPEAVELRVNIPDFRRQLEAVGARVEKQIARRAANAGARIFRDAARSRAPVLSGLFSKTRTPGALKRNIVVARSRRAQRGEVVYSVIVRTARKVSATKRAKHVARGDPFYWYFLEAGWIPRGPGGKFRGGERTRALRRSRAIAGGSRRITEYRFLQPAFQAVKSNALNAVIRTLTEELAKENRGVS